MENEAVRFVRITATDPEDHWKLTDGENVFGAEGRYVARNYDY